MRSSETIENLSGALVRAQGGLKNPVKDSKADAGKFSYRYASLPAILDEVRPVLELNDLTVLQETVTTDSGIGVTTRIVHKSGEWIELGPLLMVRSNSPQDNGSALTYARRYSLTAALNLAADEDDDGAAATKRGSAGVAAAQTAPSRRPDPSHSPAKGVAGDNGTGPSRDTTAYGEGAARPEESPVPLPIGAPERPATTDQWAKLLSLVDASTKAAAALINEKNGTDYTYRTAKAGASWAELEKAMT